MLIFNAQIYKYSRTINNDIPINQGTAILFSMLIIIYQALDTFYRARCLFLWGR